MPSFLLHIIIISIHIIISIIPAHIVAVMKMFYISMVVGQREVADIVLLEDDLLLVAADAAASGL